MGEQNENRGAVRSRRVAEALARFGLYSDPGERWIGQRSDSREVQRAADAVVSSRSPITLITGESGTGKSTLLREIASTLFSRGVRVINEANLKRPADVPIVDISDDPLDLWLRLLARAGLGEARLLGRSADRLSVGERHRLRVACCFAEAMRAPGSVVLIDEFVSPLDRATAEAVCAGVSRWARAVAAKSGVRLIVASAHEDLPGWLSPCEMVRCRESVPGFDSKSEARTGSSIRIERGTMADYEPLHAFHYLAGPPATVAGVWRAIRTTAHGERLAGVLIASYPTLNGRWRQLAWPSEYVGSSREAKRDAAERLNRDVRCLSRVIVEPASRGMGVARRLVEHYLADPLTARTEAVAAMGALSPFFARAGMSPWLLTKREVDERFASVLQRAGLSPIDVLTGGRGSNARAALDRPGVARGLEVWVNATAEARRARSHGVSEAELFMDAACRLIATPIAYTAERGSG